MVVLRKELTAHLSFPDRRHASRRDIDKWMLQKAKELEAALGISQALFEHFDIEDLVEEALKNALKVVNAEAGSILLAEPKSKMLVFRYVSQVKDKPLIGKGIPWDHGIAGAVFQSGEAEIILDAKQDPRHFAGIDESIGYTTCDMVVIPLKRLEGQPIGVLEVMNKQNGRLDEEDVSLLSIVSAFTAMAIEQIRLSKEAKLAEVVHLLGDISHDIKNLLMPVVTAERLLDNELKELFEKLPESEVEVGKVSESREFFDEVLDMLRNSTRRIQDRMKEIADCVKGLSAPPQFAQCLVADIVENVVKTLSLLASERKISINTEGLKELPPIDADERRLFNAFYNLINNAIEEVPPDGSITIRGSGVQAIGMIQISVADNGRGMPPEVCDSLFSAGAISRKPGGTGLGTKIIKDVIDAHNGQITVQSEEEVGTTFLLHLPVQQ